MRVMVIVNGNEEAASKMTPAQLAKMVGAMGAYNDALVKAGVLISAEGLQPTSKAKRVVFSGRGVARVVDGPFTETKEVIGGYYLWQVKSMDEALEWARRCPCDQDWESNLELRVVAELDEFAPELRGDEERWRAELAQRKP